MNLPAKADKLHALQHNVFERFPLEDKSVQAIITSPPYFSLRLYDIPNVIIGGNPECEHEFITEITQRPNAQGGKGHKQDTVKGSSYVDYYKRETQSSICLKCQAFKGQYGFEPDFKMYIEHTKLWLKEAWRVLRDDGCFFLNIGDSYNGSGKASGMNIEDFTEKQQSNTGSMITSPTRIKGYPSKCQLLIPERISIMMVDELGWIRRNFIVWHKNNAMPESVTDRFSKKWEPILFFTKKEKYYFDLDTIKEPLMNRETGNKILSGELKGKNPGDVWAIPTQPSPEKHYAMFPEKLVERMILCSTKAGDTVLDPFCGSGTTILVAEKLNRIGIGFDLGYEDIQKRRLKEIQKEML